MTRVQHFQVCWHVNVGIAQYILIACINQINRLFICFHGRLSIIIFVSAASACLTEDLILLLYLILKEYMAQPHSVVLEFCIALICLLHKLL